MASMVLGRPLLDCLERMGYGGLVLDTAGQVIQINSTGLRLLGPFSPNGTDDTHPDWGRQALKALLRLETTSRFRMDEDSWVVLRGKGAEPSRPLILRSVPLKPEASSGPHTVVVLVDLDTAPGPSTEALQKIFGLTPSEARLAIEVTKGRSPEEIAASHGVAVGTTRKQLASVFAKTGTHRQAELVALLARVAILP
jgi:DNA-binding CsgD family transcriptional regulator